MIWNFWTLVWLFCFLFRVVSELRLLKPEVWLFVFSELRLEWLLSLLRLQRRENRPKNRLWERLYSWGKIFWKAILSARKNSSNLIWLEFHLSKIPRKYSERLLSGEVLIWLIATPNSKTRIGCDEEIGGNLVFFGGCENLPLF